MATTTPEAGSIAAQLRLMAWLSPAFPVGSFSYSHGLERAVHDGLVENGGELQDWIAFLIEHGSGCNDAVLFAEAWRCASDGRSLDTVCELGEALAGSAERHRETMLQGAAFIAAIRNWDGISHSAINDDMPYCVAVGATCGGNGIPLQPALAAYLQGFASNLIQAAIRLSVIGQSEAIAALGALETVIHGTAARAASSSLDDLGSAAFQSDLVSMTHETQYSRLFRS